MNPIGKVYARRVIGKEFVMTRKSDMKNAVGGGGNRLACESFGGRLFERQRSEDAKRHSLLRLMKFDLFRKIVDI